MYGFTRGVRLTLQLRIYFSVHVRLENATNQAALCAVLEGRQRRHRLGWTQGRFVN